MTYLILEEIVIIESNWLLIYWNKECLHPQPAICNLLAKTKNNPRTFISRHVEKNHRQVKNKTVVSLKCSFQRLQIMSLKSFSSYVLETWLNFKLHFSTH